MRRRGGAADRRRGMLHVTGDTLFGRRRRAPVCQIESTLEDTTLEKKFGHGNQPITKQVPGLLEEGPAPARSGGMRSDGKAGLSGEHPLVARGLAPAPPSWSCGTGAVSCAWTSHVFTLQLACTHR